LLARQARQRRGVAALRALQGGLRAAQPTLELAQLTRPDACGADADGRGLSDRVAGIGGDALSVPGDQPTGFSRWLSSRIPRNHHLANQRSERTA
jgi:hypothetical protein